MIPGLALLGTATTLGAVVMSLLELPNELILTILESMSLDCSDDVTLVCKRINRVSYSCARLQRRRAARKNARAMIARFGHREEYEARSGLSVGKLSHVDVELYELGRVPEASYSSLDYLDLRDDLSWFSTSQRLLRYPEEGSHLEQLVRSSEAAGVTLPKSFVIAMANLDLFNRELKLHSSSPLRLGDLTKCHLGRSCGDPLAEKGYVLPFMHYYDGDYSLYLNAAGQHCVLCLRPLSWNVVDRGRMYEKPVLVTPNNFENVALLGVSFEHFWANWCLSVNARREYPDPFQLEQYMNHLPERPKSGNRGRYEKMLGA